MPSGVTNERLKLEDEYKEMLKPVRKSKDSTNRNDKPPLFDWVKVANWFMANFDGDPVFKGDFKKLDYSFNLGGTEDYDAVNIWWGILLCNKANIKDNPTTSGYLKALYYTVEPYMPYSLQGIGSIKSEIMKSSVTYSQELYDKMEEFNCWFKNVKARCEIYFARLYHLNGSKQNEIILSRLFKDNWGDSATAGSNLSKAVQEFKLVMNDV